ncbi:hypothetical protein, partial [Bacteroides sp.]|uniref:hypothetical protein n=1 Tax=Bacteroides sp. TaxID=29523 RepID=UPI003AAC3933
SLYLHQFQEQSEAMQRNPHSYQIATGYRTFYSLSLIYQPIKKKRLFLWEKSSKALISVYTPSLSPGAQAPRSTNPNIQ